MLFNGRMVRFDNQVDQNLFFIDTRAPHPRMRPIDGERSCSIARDVLTRHQGEQRRSAKAGLMGVALGPTRGGVAGADKMLCYV